MPFSPLRLLVMVLIFGLLLTFVQIGLLTIAFAKLGLSPESAVTLLLCALFGSLINLPVMRIQAEAPADDAPPPWPGLLRGPVQPFTGTTLIAVNVGGCIIPVLFSLHLMYQIELPPAEVLLAVAAVTGMAYGFSRPIPRLGVVMPMFIAPLTAALAAVLINVEHGAALAYISGTLGVLIGADLLRLPDIRKLGAPIASLGGAGTFDGIFITGIVAALLA
ncbi:MAG: DUF1614 domain-containing protein [Thiohalobacteraceae bacterium]|nr:DUF1614 domain-containing protein [Gammaproteobacteria bacterium]